ncbi:acyl-CoA dehydrogenase [Nocardioides mangrovicus]|uniref:Acyl-CoA dehydrogenase n=1 Tax=Nocardioides mangrovicus TaxID=2478913 RepID=A0A3L8NWZ6_9ACTN|nr:acyl-CoA dehydrogenase family protein [Nocardioides mangrovicus]RLV47454.1 acyl-CoA dehydrogenase [Nocardioides mangrovicus]
MWDFSTEPDFQERLDWASTFVREECESVDVLFPGGGAPYDVQDRAARAFVEPMREEVKAHGLWACHLGPELGGPGYGQVRLGLLNEILGRSHWAPTIFGTAAPDTGNAEILAMFGTEEQKARYLQPLLDGDIVSAFSMTEPQAGADPKEFVCAARRDGDEWVIDGEKWFTSNARYAEFLIVMAVTDPDAAPHARMSMFVVPRHTTGVEIVRNVATFVESADDDGTHAYVRYTDVRVPLDHMLGGPGEGFKVAQARLGGGRIHHAMRTVGRCARILDMMAERALSRRTQGTALSDKQSVQQALAESSIELAQLRLLVLHTAWVIDTQPPGAARNGIAMCKVQMSRVQHDILQRAVHLHGSLGTTIEMPLAQWWSQTPHLALVDGPTEVHRTTVAKGLLGQYSPAPGLFPTEHVPTRLAAAREKYADRLAAL